MPKKTGNQQNTMTPLFQYLRETRTELEHVSWPTQTQTIVYTIFVALLSVGIAAYLGFFDYVFTTGLTRLVNNAHNTRTPVVQTVPVHATTTASPSTEPNFTISTSTNQ